MTEDSQEFLHPGGKLAIPLLHKYTEQNLSFSGLKGQDLIAAEVMECRNKNNEKWLDLYLCLVTKYKRGLASSDYPLSFLDFQDHEEEEITFDKWVGVEDEPESTARTPLDIDIDMDIEVVCLYGEPFGEPDREEYEEDTGLLEFWYHTAMLVAQPKPQPETPPISYPERLRLEMGNSGSGGPVTNDVTSNTVANESGQCDSKRQMLDAEVTADTEKRATSDTLQLIDLSHVGPGPSGHTGQRLNGGVPKDKTTSGTIPITDLSDNE